MNALKVSNHPSPSLVQMFLWGVIGTGLVIGGTIGYAVAEIATRKWPNGGVA